MDFTRYAPAGASNGKVKISLEDGSTVKDLLDILGIPINEPKVLVINGISEGMSDKVNNRELKERDVVAIFPPVGGG